MQIHLEVFASERAHSTRQTSLMPKIGLTVVNFDFEHMIVSRIARMAGRDGMSPLAPATRRRVMIVDDEKDILLIFKSGLERNGFVVDVFNNPYDALLQYKSEFYDLLLLDVRMPGTSGFELFREMLKIDCTAKVCFISAFEIHKDEVARYLPDRDQGCIIKKPVSLKDLVRIVNEEIFGNP